MVESERRPWSRCSLRPSSGRMGRIRMLCVWVLLGRAMSPAYPNVRTALPMIWPASRRLQDVLPRIGLAAVGLRDETVTTEWRMWRHSHSVAVISAWILSTQAGIVVVVFMMATLPAFLVLRGAPPPYRVPLHLAHARENVTQQDAMPRRAKLGKLVSGAVGPCSARLAAR
jgi:hypothetical protein